MFQYQLRYTSADIRIYICIYIFSGITDTVMNIYKYLNIQQIVQKYIYTYICLLGGGIVDGSGGIAKKSTAKV